MKLKMPKIVSVLLAAVALAVSVPVSAFAAQTRDEPIEIVCYTPAVLADDGSVVQDAQEVYSEVLNLDGSITLPTTANGRSVVCWSTVNGNIKVPAGVAYNAATLQNQLYDDWGMDPSLSPRCMPSLTATPRRRSRCPQPTLPRWIPARPSRRKLTR